MQCTPSQLAKLYDVDRRTVTNWLNEEPPCPSTGTGRERRFDTAAVARWHAERAVRQAAASTPALGEIVEATERARKVRAEADLKELELAERRRQLIPADEYQRRLDDFIGGLAATAAGRLHSFERDIVRAVDAPAARKITQRMHAALMAGAQEYAELVEAEARALDEAEGTAA